MPRTLSRIRIAAAADPAWYAALPAYGVYRFPLSREADGQGPIGPDYSRNKGNTGGGRLIDRVNINGVMTEGPWWTNTGSGGHANTSWGNQGGVSVYGPLNSDSPGWVILRAPFRAGQAAIDWWTANRPDPGGQTYGGATGTPWWGDNSWTDIHPYDCSQLYDPGTNRLVRHTTKNGNWPPTGNYNKTDCWGGTLDFSAYPPEYTNTFNALSAWDSMGAASETGPIWIYGGKLWYYGRTKVYSRDILTDQETLVGTLTGAITYFPTSIFNSVGAATALDGTTVLAVQKYVNTDVNGTPSAYWIDPTNPRVVTPVTFAGDPITSGSIPVYGAMWMLEHAWGSFWLRSATHDFFRIAKPANPANPWTVTRLADFPSINGFNRNNPMDVAYHYRGQFAACDRPKGFVVAHPTNTDYIYFVKVP